MIPKDLWGSGSLPSLCIGRVPTHDVTADNSIFLKRAGKADAITTSVEAMRTSESASKQMFAPIAGLWGALLNEIADQTFRLVNRTNIDRAAEGRRGFQLTRDGWRPD